MKRKEFYFLATQQKDQYITATSSEILTYYGVMAVVIAFLLWVIWAMNNDEQSESNDDKE